MTTGTIIICIIAAVLILLVIYLIAAYNALIRQNNQVEEAFSTMDVYLKKRWDLIPNLVETVKGYAAHERSTFEKIVSLRNQSYDTISPEEKFSLNNELTNAISKIIAVAENYPDLKANQNFLNLNKELVQVEKDIANARKYYNATVRDFNNKVQIFPSNLVASMAGFSKKTMFEAATEERQNVEVHF